MARNGRSKAEIKGYIEKTYGYDLDRTWEFLNRNYGWDSSCQGTVPEAIIAFLESTDFEDAIRKAVSMGGDSDTLACITGGIAEAFYGEIPEGMVEVTQRVFPPIFHKILDALKSRSSYGEIVPNRCE
jgi:ADP-ribosylglycohydrolase